MRDQTLLETMELFMGLNSNGMIKEETHGLKKMYDFTCDNLCLGTESNMFCLLMK